MDKKYPGRFEIETLRELTECDLNWYLEAYPDVTSLRMDPALHYLVYGRHMGRRIGPTAMPGWLPSGLLDRLVPKRAATPYQPRLRLAPFLHKGQLTGPSIIPAYEAALRGDHEGAIRRAERDLPADRHYSIAIFKANAALAVEDKAGWLAHFNSYLTYFGVAPIKLKDTPGPLIEQIGTEDLPGVSNGPLITVIMPVWNAEKTVYSAAMSVLNQTWKNIELIAVNDCSDDNSGKILESIAKSDARVRVIHNSENVGPYVSRNIALLGACGTYITCHDADDWAHPQRLEHQADFLIDRGSVACLSAMTRMEASGRFNRLNAPGQNTEDGITRTAFISLMIQREYLQKELGGWDDVRFGADSELIRRIEASTAEAIPRLLAPTMICFDNPDGLTNHPVFGHNEETGVSPVRGEYAKNFKRYHKTLHRTGSFLPFPHDPRLFPAPSQALSPEGRVRSVLSTHLKSGWPDCSGTASVDIAIMTDLRFPGGNASSTMQEMDWLNDKGLSVALIHCPAKGSVGKPISERYWDKTEAIFDLEKAEGINCKVLIIRSPSTVIGPYFNSFARKIISRTVVFVKNNSQRRTNGDPVYDVSELSKALRQLRTGQGFIAPISPVMRAEVRNLGLEKLSGFNLTPVDWTPGFDIESYYHHPKPVMRRPYTIGRHGRDGQEKWLSNSKDLLAAYPEGDEFKISILGGARNAFKNRRYFPDNWDVIDFGVIPPHDYLKNLDVFVYFPNVNLVEAFGRTIIEAMIAARPCVLPLRFAAVFGDLALYCEPANVATVVRRLAQDDPGRVRFLTEVQQIATNRYGPEAMVARFKDLLPGLKDDLAKKQELSAESLRYRAQIMAF